MVAKPDLASVGEELGDASEISRRAFFLRALAAAGALTAVPGLLERAGLVEAAQAATPDLTQDTLNGLVAFFVPGPDAYSVNQGQSTPEHGGIDGGAAIGLHQGLNAAYSFMPTLADTVATLLNSTATAINPGASGPFASSFANLSFTDKGKVYAALEGNPQSAPLFGTVPLLIAFLTYSELTAYDPASRSVTGRPLGWTLSNYPGVHDGLDDFQGYYKNRRKADA